jgi:hypothetical protein
MCSHKSGTSMSASDGNANRAWKNANRLSMKTPFVQQANKKNLFYSLHERFSKRRLVFGKLRHEVGNLAVDGVPITKVQHAGVK